MNKKLLGALIAVATVACLGFGLVGNAFATSYKYVELYYDVSGEYTEFSALENPWGQNDSCTYAYPDGNILDYSNEKPSTDWYFTKTEKDVTLVLVKGTYDNVRIVSKGIDFTIDIQGDVVLNQGDEAIIFRFADLTITGKGSLTIGSKDSRCDVGILGDEGTLKIIDTKITIFDKYDGIAVKEGEGIGELQIINSIVTIDDLGAEGDFKGNADEDCVPSRCAIHVGGPVTIDGSKVVAQSKNQYGIFADGVLTLKAESGDLDVIASGKQALRIEDVQGLDFSALENAKKIVTLKAGADEASAAKIDFTDLENDAKYIHLTAVTPEPEPEPAPEPVPETGDATPFAAVAGLIALAVAGIFVARKRLA